MKFFCDIVGVFMWDVDGNRYYDFFSVYSVVNQGYFYFKIIKVLIDQVFTLVLILRVFYNNVLGEYEEYVIKFFGFDKVFFMNIGKFLVCNDKGLYFKGKEIYFKNIFQFSGVVV